MANILIIPITEWLNGPYQRLHHFVKCWNRDNEVHVLYIERFEHLSCRVNIKERERYVKIHKIPTIKCRSLALFFVFNFVFQFIYTLKIIAKNNIDVIIVETIGPGTAALLAGKIKKRKVIFDYADYLPSFVSLYISNKFISKIFQEIAKMMTIFNIKFSDATVVISDGLMQDAMKYTKNVFKITNGVDMEYFNCGISNKLKKNNEYLTIGFIGAIEGWTKIEDVIDAISELNKEGIKTKLMVVGNGPRLDFLLNYINKKNANDFIKFVGWVPYSEIHQYLDIFDICVLPFDNSKISQLCMPMKIHEYAISKKPIISAPLPEIKKAYGNTILYAVNSQEYIFNIKKLIEDNYLYSALSQKAFEIAKNEFSWKSLSDKYEKVMKDILTKEE